MTPVHQKIKNINMSYEVDIHAVGEESTSGDAIALRFGKFLTDPSDQCVVVIDGGFKSSGEKLVKRIKEEYNTTHVDLVISTHPDRDHINGIRVVLEELTVGELWMHTPWNISESVKTMAEVQDLSPWVSSSAIKKSLQAAYDLEKLAIQKGVKIVEPFEGTSRFGNKIHVLGPSLDYYYELVSQFEDSPNGLSLSSMMEKVKKTITELWHRDELVDPSDDDVNARNNSSVITLIQLEETFLFLGDSGVPAITNAANYTDSKNFDLKTNVKYIHIPHHGSKRNIGPSILNRIIGPILPKDQKVGKTAFISAAPDHPKHPSKRVRNAFIRRGVDVSETCGSDHCYKSTDVPLRPGWIPITYVEFCENYDEE